MTGIPVRGWGLGFFVPLNPTRPEIPTSVRLRVGLPKKAIEEVSAYMPFIGLIVFLILLIVLLKIVGLW